MSSTEQKQQDSVTFDVADTKLDNQWGKPQSCTVKQYVEKQPFVQRKKGIVLKTTEQENTIRPDINNGFVGACLRAYNQHYHLVLRPDDVWIAITTSLSRFIDKNAKEMRSTFVDHDNVKDLVVYGVGDIQSANYEQLIKDMMVLIDENTKDDIAEWLTCDFTTSTETTRTVSRVVLMGAMKNYFNYKMCLECGLPKVTLQGTKADWQVIRNRIDKMLNWGNKDLVMWHSVLFPVLDNFVGAFDNNVDKDFWNRIACETGGGSGPSYLKGWILSFIAFDDVGKYILNPIDQINETNDYGKVDTNDIPTSTVEVPVTIDDNGTEYKTIFYAGNMVCRVDAEKIRPCIDWALIDVTKRDE